MQSELHRQPSGFCGVGCDTLLFAFAALRRAPVQTRGSSRLPVRHLPALGITFHSFIVSSSSNFSLRKIAVPAYGPSLLFGMVEGAIYPILALTARNLGASIAEAGIIVALIGVGALVNNIPAALLTARFGERLSMTGAALFTIFALLLCISATTLLTLAAGVFMIGMALAVFLLARQTYLTEAVPVAMRARALSTLGGVMRVGLFAGPFISAGIMQLMGPEGAYWLATAAAAAAGALAFTLPDLPAPAQTGASAGQAAADSADPPRSKKMSAVWRDYRRSFLTLGFGCMLVAAIRGSRQIVIPLWATHIALDAATVSLVYGAMGAIDMLLFYPAGKIMDRYGRLWVAVPCMVIMSIALGLMPFTTGFLSFLLVTLLLGFGNGIGSGLVMTIGADASPSHARPQFLGLWRFMTDTGSCGGPLLVSTVAGAAGLASGLFTASALGLTAAAIFWKFLPRK